MDNLDFVATAEWSAGSLLDVDEAAEDVEPSVLRPDLLLEIHGAMAIRILPIARACAAPFFQGQEEGVSTFELGGHEHEVRGHNDITRMPWPQPAASPGLLLEAASATSYGCRGHAGSDR
jgi:hypothetical protein